MPRTDENSRTAPHWPSERLMRLLGVTVPIVQAPMAGASDAAMAIAVSQSGGLGSLPCAMLDDATMRNQVATIQQHTDRPFAINFFCHRDPAPTAAQQQIWLDTLAPYYAELGLEPPTARGSAARRPFDATACELIEALRPPVVSFHFGLPEAPLLARVRATGARIIASATTTAEARWLEAHGADAIIAQGAEAGGHRGMFLSSTGARSARADWHRLATQQPGTMALVPQVVDAVSVPVIAAGGIGDARGIAAAFALGADGVQLGTAFLYSAEALVAPLHRQALATATDDATALTNLFSGRPARGVLNRLMSEQGPLSSSAPPFPAAGSALAPLKAGAELRGSNDFTSLWAGQGAALSRATAQAAASGGEPAIGAGALLETLVSENLARLQQSGR